MNPSALVIGIAGRHHVAPAQFRAIEAALPRRRVDQPFDDVHRLGEAGPRVTPIGVVLLSTVTTCSAIAGIA